MRHQQSGLGRKRKERVENTHSLHSLHLSPFLDVNKKYWAKQGGKDGFEICNKKYWAKQGGKDGFEICLFVTKRSQNAINSIEDAIELIKRYVE